MTSWNREKIVTLLNTNDIAVERAILAIYKRQTIDEQSVGETKHSNGIGFSGAHAATGTYFAKWLLSGRRLTGKHLDKARTISLRYVSQLLEEANSRVPSNNG